MWPPATFPPLIPTPTRATDTREAISEQDPRHSYIGSGEQSLLRPLGWDPPPLQPGGLDLEMTEGPSSTPGSPAGLGRVCSSGASSLAAFPEIQFPFLLGPAHSWPQKAGFSNQP